MAAGTPFERRGARFDDYIQAMRKARYGSGWFAPTGSPDQLAPLMKKLDQAYTLVGRDRSEIAVTAMWIDIPICKSAAWSSHFQPRGREIPSRI